MTTPRSLFATALFALSFNLGAATPENPAIDMQGFLDVAGEAAQHRESRRVDEVEFMRMAREPGTVVLDARSAEKYELLHVRGAINLSFPDITVASLAQTLPDKDARILIYCNNNFANAEVAFPTKRIDASLNLSTYIALYSYGYRNIYELGPLLELDSTVLQFDGAAAVAGSASMLANAAAKYSN
jgi:phage shock protein E